MICTLFHFQGGYMQAKIQKLQEQCQKDQRQKSSNIFSGVSIFVNGYISKLTYSYIFNIENNIYCFNC